METWGGYSGVLTRQASFCVLEWPRNHRSFWLSGMNLGFNADFVKILQVRFQEM